MPRPTAKHHKKTGRHTHVAPKAKRPRVTKPAHPKEVAAPEGQMMRAPALKEQPLTVFFERVEIEKELPTVQVVEVEDWPL
jgi:hypothetical protein